MHYPAAARAAFIVAFPLYVASCGAEGHISEQIMTGSVTAPSTSAGDTNSGGAGTGPGAGGGTNTGTDTTAGTGTDTGTGAGGGTGSTPVDPAPTDPTTPAPTPTPTPTPSSCSATKDTYANYVKDIFAVSCANCHSTTYGSLDAIQSVQGKIRSEISSGAMPPRSVPFKQTDSKARLTAWLNCPAPLP